MLKNNEIYKSIWKELENGKSFFITSHINPDGDAISSQILIALILQKMGKKYNIVMQDNFPDRYRFILDEYYDVVIPELLNIPKGVDLITQLPENYFPQTVIIMDSGGTDRLGDFSKYVKKIKTIINIDHHTGSKHSKGKFNLIDINASSTGEIIFDLIKQNRYKLDMRLAKLIYISIATDTRFFTQANTSARTHKIIAELIDKGVNPESISYQLQAVDGETLKIFGKVLNRLKIEFAGQLVWSYISQKEIEKVKSRDVDGLVEMLRGISDTKVAVLFKEVANDRIKVSLRGKNGFNVFSIADNFGGGGHIQAAGCIINDTLDNTIQLIIKKFKDIL